MSMQITTDLLREIDAPERLQAWFAAQFSVGATWHESVNAMRVVDPSWSVWLAWYCPAYIFSATFGARLAVQRDDWGRAILAQVCSPAVPGAPDYAGRLALQQNDHDRAVLALWCDPGVPGAPDWWERLALQRYDYERALLGFCCPVGVPGATLTARMAVQPDGTGRAAVVRMFSE
jgi:hypothetical protein